MREWEVKSGQFQRPPCRYDGFTGQFTTSVLKLWASSAKLTANCTVQDCEEGSAYKTQKKGILGNKDKTNTSYLWLL